MSGSGWRPGGFCFARDLVYCALCRRVRGEDRVPVEAWRQSSAACLPKPGADHKALNVCRAVTMVSSAHKLFEGVWGSALQPHLRLVPTSILGFRPGCRPLDVAAPLQMLLRRAHEWRSPLAIESMDVRSAFDCMRLPFVATALLEQGALAQLVVSWLTDALSSSPMVAFDLAVVAPVPLQVGCKQGGGGATPMLWNILLAGPVDRLRREWK